MDHNTPAAAQHTLDEAAVRAEMTEALRSTAMLADVTIGTWSGERSDPTAMTELAKSAGATGKVGRVVKNMLAGADTRLKECRSAFVAVRSAHFSLTMPWSGDTSGRLSGPRLLPNMLFEKYLALISERRAAAAAALDVMLEHYDADVAVAREKLGDLAEENYPTHAQIRGMFYAKVDFEPLPSAAGFQHLPEHFSIKLAARLRQKQEVMMAGAQSYLWEVVRDRVERLYDRMQDPEAIFKTSTLDHVRSLCALMPAWNLAGDERVATVVTMLGNATDGATADAIRSSDKLRASLAADMKDVINLLDEWGVGRAG